MELSKQDMELSKQEMELFLPLPGLCWKNFFYKMFLIWSKGSEVDFQNRKWNYSNRKWNYFSHFQTSAEKTSFTKCFSFDPRGPKLIFETGNGIIQTGNGFISPLPASNKTSTGCNKLGQNHANTEHLFKNWIF